MVNARREGKAEVRQLLVRGVVVDKTWREADKNMASGARGELLEGSRRIDQEAWFLELRKRCENIRFGISPITGNEVVRNLETIAVLA